MDYSYPILSKITDHYIKIPHDVEGIYLICCQHMLESQLRMFQELIRFGFDPAKIIVLGKIYSTNNEILSELNALGIRALQPFFSGQPFDKEHQDNCKAVLSKISKETECVILDDGAEMIALAAESGQKVFFAVEQTSSGFRKLEKVALPFPVLNVARSGTKLIQESPLVARHAFGRMKEYFDNKGIPKPKIVIIGLGPIGESMREVFLSNNYDAEGFDLKHGHDNLLDILSNLQPDVVIGATGSPILRKEEVDHLPTTKPLYLISMSSSDREFPVSSYRNDHTNTHTDVIYKNIIFVNNGFPMSFMGNRIEATPMEMEKTMCLLGGAVMHGLTHQISGTGLLDVPKELETLINS